jgi:uncharacterized protein YegP (UPF0339 family)
MPAQYILRKAKNDQFYFTLTANNNEPILSSEMYTSKDGAKNGIQSVMTNSPEDSRYTKLTASGGKFYFRLKAANNQTIGTSEMYNSEAGRDKGIEAVKKVGPTAKLSDQTA